MIRFIQMWAHKAMRIRSIPLFPFRLSCSVVQRLLFAISIFGNAMYLLLKESMSLIHSVLFSPTFVPLSPAKPIKQINRPHLHIPSSSGLYVTCKRFLPLPAATSISFPPINSDYLEREFSGHGVTFKDIGGSCIIRLALDNGSVASLMLPSGLITSYKARMWHGGLLELLHTSVSEGVNGGAIVQGGVSLAFKCDSDEEESWSPNIWSLHDVRGSPQEEFIQVELISSNSEGEIEAKHILTLQQDTLSSELVITNSKPSPIRMMGSILSHLTVSTPDATYLVGLEGSDFFSKPPVSSNFSIIPTELRQRKVSDSVNTRRHGTTFQELISRWSSWKQNNAESMERVIDEELEGEEKDNYKHLTEVMSRVYTSAPRNFTIIDRGRRNSVIVAREGFSELYMFSPGSRYEWYGKYAYVCTGQSAILQPIVLASDGQWRGVQHLHNPNL